MIKKCCGADLLFLSGNGVSLQNGGPAGGIWMLCVVLCGMLAVTLCIAEQTSMHPSSGGPYVWVGIHLPGRWGKCISYVVGMLLPYNLSADVTD